MSQNTPSPQTESIDAELARRLLDDADFRRRFIRFWAQNEVASEIRALRKARGLRQAEVAEMADTGQSAISRIEKADYDGWTYKTLIGIADVLRARLRIQFERIEDVARRYSANPAYSSPDVITDEDTTASAAELKGGDTSVKGFRIEDNGESSTRALPVM